MPSIRLEERADCPNTKGALKLEQKRGGLLCCRSDLLIAISLFGLLHLEVLEYDSQEAACRTTSEYEEIKIAV